MGRWRRLEHCNSFRYIGPEGRVDIWIPPYLKTLRSGWLVDLEASIKRQKNGTKLVYKAIEKARRLGLKSLRLSVTDTEEAKSFWKTFDIEDERGVLEI